MIKGNMPLFNHQKAKETEQKIIENVNLMQRKIKKSVYDIKGKIHRNSKISRAGNYVSIILGLLLLMMSWSAQIEWLIWLSTISIFSNVFLLTFQKKLNS